MSRATEIALLSELFKEISFPGVCPVYSRYCMLHSNFSVTKVERLLS